MPASPLLPGWLDSVVGPVVAATGVASTDELTGDLLRQWGSSEVWRLSSGSGSVIVKRGSDTQAAEADAYEQLVRPLDLPAPELLHLERLEDAVVLVMADVGGVTLEQNPSLEGFLAATELLVELRSKPVAGVTDFGPDRLLDLVDRIRLGLAGVVVQSLSGARSTAGLDRASDLAAPVLAELHRAAPLAVVHGDFVPKNLVTDGTRWTAVDWPAAYRAPHLGDLHTLLRDARTGGFATDPIVAHYVGAAGADPDQVRRQLVLGGVCFSLLALCWIVEEGLRTVPQSKDWIDGLLIELDDLTGELR
jgi:aminoglycoside phosphotransferase